eukprot:TRINITY_DN2198_c0_g2_i7.p1 TRINITY_DN2198_c0_g2~~TRINITY_DN2198_c0_g2_i7.p1  ORF type:complete len:108 (-),score=14.95 TRINITY_DN2198_c0_g2_i7:139-462(-)
MRLLFLPSCVFQSGSEMTNVKASTRQFDVHVYAQINQSLQPSCFATACFFPLKNFKEERGTKCVQTVHITACIEKHLDKFKVFDSCGHLHWSDAGKSERASDGSRQS